MMRLILWLFLMVVILSPAYAQSDASAKPEQYVTLSVYADKTAVVPGEDITLAFHQDIYPHWHTYWQNPGDSGEPTRITWDLPKGFEAGEIEWPTPARMPYEFLLNFGYANEATYLVPISVPANFQGETVTLKGEMSWLVCKEICIPEFEDFSLTLPVAESAQTDNEDIFSQARQNTPVDKSWAASFTKQGSSFVLKVETSEIPAEAGVDVFPVEWGLIKNPADQDIKISDDGLTAIIPAGERDLSEVDQSSFILRVTPPDSERITGYKITAKQTQTPLVSDVPDVADTMQTHSLGMQILFAILGGMILNLMPCVFPILSLKALGIAQAKGKKRAENIMHGLSYTAGVLLSFGGFAAILLSLRSSIDVSLGWGFQLQNPTIILLFAFLMFTIGLNLSGLFNIGGKFTSAGSNLSQKSGITGSFFTGVLATLVATPCSAPFMAGAMGYAILQPAPIAMMIFLCVGFGLALPYLLLTLSPSLQKLMPKPGSWMETFKEFLAFPMYLTAVWLLWVLVQQSGADALFMALAAMIGMAFIIWLTHKSKPWFKIPAIVLYFGLIALTAVSLADTPQFVEPVPYSEATLNEALASDQPVFVNMTAAWCITCKINERVGIKTETSYEAMTENNVIYVYGDWTSYDANITDYLESFGRSGVPLYVFYPAPDKSGQRPQPQVLPQLLKPTTLKSYINRQN